MAAAVPRKIVHIDMDAFYASVEQRDRPELRGQPVVVAWQSERSVVCAASYEARPFGVRSAMSLRRALRLCPQAQVVKPDFTRYREASRLARAIFQRHTDLVEPLSLDEAYLDVTAPRSGLASATEVAEAIRRSIREELHLVASAGVAPNKFLAKVASDWRKPDGLFVIKPQQVEAFLEPLPVARIPGVGAVMQRKLAELGLHTCGELRRSGRDELLRRFGRWGQRLHELAHGIDERPVDPSQPVKSISAEDTFEQDQPLAALAPMIEQLAERVWRAARKTERVPRTVVLKLKTSDFRILTRSLTPALPPADAAALCAMALDLRQRVSLPEHTRYRLVGVGLGNFRDAADPQLQPDLFERDGLAAALR
ncbi:MAG TPA: DNA polymerase IV [Rhodanobacteraceae bacterium]|nr:DNA polymerase IV [Rhodanobacteraceae bacterium]